MWKKLADYFNVSVDELMNKDNNIRYTVKAGGSTSPAKEKWIQQYRTDTKIIYNDVDITSLVNANYGERTSVTREQQYAYTEYTSRSGHVIYARRKLLSILNEIHSKSINEISENLSDFIEYVENYVVYWYKRCWNNIDDLFPIANSLDTLYDLLDKCLCVDMIAQQEFTLNPINEDFDWLREKLHP